MAKKVLVLRGDSYKAVGAMFEARGYSVTYDSSKLAESQLCVFTGGSDVSPWVYGEEPMGARGCDEARDRLEIEIYETAQAMGIPCVGICRGGQLLNVLNGGKMIQDIGHTISGDVWMDLNSGDSIEVRVDHHQGILAPDDHPVMGTFCDWDKLRAMDYEVWYGKTKSLCVQYHPEWNHAPTEERFFNLLEEYLP